MRVEITDHKYLTFVIKVAYNTISSSFNDILIDAAIFLASTSRKEILSSLEKL